MAQHTVEESVSPKDAADYTREIIENLSNGVRPLYDAKKAGVYAGFINLLLENYSPSDVEVFKNELAALTGKYDVLKRALEVKDEATGDPRLTTSTSGKEVFLLRSRKDIQSLPRPKFAVNQLLHEEAVSMLFGPSSTGKTFWALHLSACIALGIPWFGRTVKQGHVLYVYAEGAAKLNDRLGAWEKHYGREIENIDFITYEAHLIDEQQRLIDTISEMPVKPTLVVIDTYSNCTTGLDQNKQDDVSKALASAHKIKALFHCHVLIIHHTTWQGKVNGSMAFKNHVDTMIELKREEKDSPIFMLSEKNRDIDPFEPIKLGLKRVELGIDPESQEPISSCALVLNEALSIVEKARAQQEEIEQEKILEILKIHKRLTVRQWITECKAMGISKEKFYAHRHALEDQRKIVSQDQGKGKGMYYEMASEAKQGTLGDDND